MKPAEQSDRLSLRNSILVWVAVLTIGWGCAVVLFYQLIRGDEPTAAALTAEATPENLSRIETAAGGDDKSQDESRVQPQSR